MSLYRVSGTWTNSLEERREVIVSRLKARIRIEAEKNDREKLLEQKNATNQ